MTSTAPWPNNRLAIERLYKIHQTLSSGARRSSAELAAELEVSQRTIQRDLEFLGTRFMAKIERDSSTKKYYYAEPFELPPMNLTAGEMVVFFLGEKLLQQCAGTPFEEQITLLDDTTQGLYIGNMFFKGSSRAYLYAAM